MLKMIASPIRSADEAIDAIKASLSILEKEIRLAVSDEDLRRAKIFDFRGRKAQRKIDKIANRVAAIAEIRSAIFDLEIIHS